ncbi:hypothetical protein ACIBBD_15275 [Streptomyces sp. NPDC051315]|uniref:hypothetical protein n=1 Tax=Streptomyces sp. NPDC051315 TaxID=3365650 RepID=UPI0037B3BA79
MLKLVTEKKVWYLSAGWINTTFFQGTYFAEREDAFRSRYLEITRRRNKIAHDADLIDGERRPIDEAVRERRHRLDRANRSSSPTYSTGVSVGREVAW